MTTPCRVWTGSTYPTGYGRIWVGRSTTKSGMMPVHRWTWMQANGPIPSGMQICHRCDNPPCYDHGHAFTADNTYIRPDRGTRDCRTCIRIRVAEYKERCQP